jgi:hypothetical protein
VCVNVCLADEIGDGVCNPECDNADHQFDGYDCVVCGVNEGKVDGKCVPICVQGP